MDILSSSDTRWKVGLNWILRIKLHDCGILEIQDPLVALVSFQDIQTAIFSVALTPDGKWALTGSTDNTALLWDLANPVSSPRVLSGHTDWIRSVALTPDGRWALTGSNDNTALLWDLENPDSSLTCSFRAYKLDICQ